MDAFDELYPRIGIREDQALSFFLSGLVDELQIPVRMFQPKSLVDVYALAKLQELTVRAMCGKPKGSSGIGQQVGQYGTSSKLLTVTTANYKPAGAIGNTKDFNRIGTSKTGPRLSSKEIEDRRSKGLCYWCDERYTPNHNCTKRRRAFVKHMIDEEVGDEGDEESGFEKTDDVAASDLQLSLHAMWGIEGTQIMRIRGKCQKKFLRILIDTRSTHNFLSTKIAEKIKCQLIQVATAVVEVANRQLLQ